jgi:elongation factor P
MKIDGVQIRIGNVLEHQNKLWIVTKTQHVKPGKGGAFNQVEMKAIKDGTKLNERFRSNDKVEKVRLEQFDYQYLYAEGEKLIFMHPETYEQVELDAELLGEKVAYLQDGMMVVVEFHENEALSMQLPEKVTLQIVETEPVVKGQTAAHSNKPAILENGIRVMVPPFINQGDSIIVNTEDDSYSERAK